MSLAHEMLRMRDLTEWRPIETAPKDGSIFLAYGKGAPEKAFIYDTKKDWKPRIRVCWWISYDLERDEPAGDGLFKKVPYTRDLGWEGGVHFRPTHWMPLPTAPDGGEPVDLFSEVRLRNPDRAMPVDEQSTEESCPGHVAAEHSPKVCGRCGVHIDSLRQPEDGEEQDGP